MTKSDAIHYTCLHPQENAFWSFLRKLRGLQEGGKINKKFRIRPKYRPVPHITLAGPISTKNERRLIKVFREICEQQTEPMYFALRGYGTFDENHVVFIKVKADRNLDEFRWKLLKALQSFCKLQPWDYNRKFNFHCTLALKLNRRKFERIKKYINSKPKIELEHVVLRVALLRNRKILSMILCWIGCLPEKKLWIRMFWPSRLQD